MMDRYVIDETCSCGATFHYDGSGPSSALQAARAWRFDHRHETVNGVLVVPEGMSLHGGTADKPPEMPPGDDPRSGDLMEKD